MWRAFWASEISFLPFLLTLHFRISATLINVKTMPLAASLFLAAGSSTFYEGEDVIIPPPGCDYSPTLLQCTVYKVNHRPLDLGT